MSGPTPNPEGNSNPGNPRPRALLSQINEHTNGSSNGGDVSPKRKSSQHIKLPERLNRPHTGLHRTLSDALRAERSREEQETLLGDGEDEDADRDGCVREPGELPGPREIFAPDLHAGLNIYYNIQRIRRLVLASIEDPYTMDQLKEPRMNVLIVKPLVDRLYDEDDISIGKRQPCDCVFYC
jgi:hypothetical protein